VKSVHRRVGRTFEREACGFDAIYTGRKGFVGRAWDKLTRKNIHERFDFTFRELGPIDGKTVFDAGCGPGHYCVEFARRGASKVVGADLAENMLAIARQNSVEAGVAVRCEFIHSDILDINTPEPFDYVIAMGFFDYIPDPQSVLNHLAKFTKSGLLASFPGRYAFRAPFRKIWRMMSGTYLRFYSEEEIRSLCKGAGLKVVKLLRQGPNLMLVAEPDSMKKIPDLGN